MTTGDATDERRKPRKVPFRHVSARRRGRSWVEANDCGPRRLVGTFGGSDPDADDGLEERVDWTQTVSLMATLVVMATGVAGFVRKVLLQETNKLRADTESLRKESRKAHDRIGGEIAQVRSELLGKITQHRSETIQLGDDLRGEIARLGDDLRGELAQVRGETTQLGVDLRGEMAQLGGDLRSEMAQLRDGQSALREGMGEIRGELRGLNHSVLALREDFRAHVLAGTN